MDEDVEFIEGSPMRQKMIPAATSVSAEIIITRSRKRYEVLIHDDKIRVRQDGSVVKWQYTFRIIKNRRNTDSASRVSVLQDTGSR